MKYAVDICHGIQLWCQSRELKLQDPPEAERILFILNYLDSRRFPF